MDETTAEQAAWWAILDAYGEEPFMPEGREQPSMPVDHRKYFEP